jgi:hypothetical protein
LDRHTWLFLPSPLWEVLYQIFAAYPGVPELGPETVMRERKSFDRAALARRSEIAHFQEVSRFLAVPGMTIPTAEHQREAEIVRGCVAP